MRTTYYIGQGVHKRTIIYCVMDGSGTVHAEGTIPAARLDPDRWMKTLPQPWTAAMEVWFYRQKEQQPRGQHTLRRISKNLYPRSSEARGESFGPLDKERSWKSPNRKLIHR